MATKHADNRKYLSQQATIRELCGKLDELLLLNVQWMEGLEQRLEKSTRAKLKMLEGNIGAFLEADCMLGPPPKSKRRALSGSVTRVGLR